MTAEQEYEHYLEEQRKQHEIDDEHFHEMLKERDNGNQHGR